MLLVGTGILKMASKNINTQEYDDYEDYEKQYDRGHMNEQHARRPL